MGLLDGALGALLGGGNAPNATAASSPLAQVLGGLIQQSGGLSGLISQLSKAGLATQVASWVGTGQNMAVSGQQITAVLGSGQLAQIAKQLGVDPNQAGGVLAQVLPHVVDHLTPTGQVTPAAAGTPQPDVLAGALSALAGRLLR
jgi:uncharacterized protein YidB (DUF937 family)